MTRRYPTAAAELAAYLANSPHVGIADASGLNVDVTLTANAGALGVDVPNPLAAKLTAQSIVLPIPPSANDYWSWSEVGVYVTKAARLYKKNVKELVQYSRLQPFTGDIAIYLHVYRPAQRGDLDNYNKVLLDALKGLAFEDDSQVIELHSWRHDDKRNPRVEVEVRKIPN